MAVMIDDVLYVDNTTLSAFASCPTKAMVKYGYNKELADTVNMPAEAGIAIHKGLEHYLMGGTEDEAIAIFQEAYEELATSQVDVGDRLGYDNVRAVLLSWIERHAINDLPYRIQDASHVEIPFDLPLTQDGKIRYVGRIDAIVQRKDGANVWYVMDTKSTGMPDGKFRRQFIIGSQMTGYVWAARQLFGDHIAGVFINVVHVASVPSSLGGCRTHKTPYSECGFLHPKHELLPPFLRSEREVNDWLLDARVLATQWRQHLEWYGDDFNNLVNGNADW